MAADVDINMLISRVRCEECSPLDNVVNQQVVVVVVNVVVVASVVKRFGVKNYSSVKHGKFNLATFPCILFITI